MEDAKKNDFSTNEVSTHYEDYKEKRGLLKEIDELRKLKLFLDEEDNRLTREIDILSGELEGVEITILAAKSHIQSFNKRKNDSRKNIENLKDKKNDLIREIDTLHFSLKTAREEEKSNSILNVSLNKELTSINNEKIRVLKRLNIVKIGIKDISVDENERLPNLAGCDIVLKHVYNVLRETQDRMEVSALLKKGV